MITTYETIEAEIGDNLYSLRRLKISSDFTPPYFTMSRFIDNEWNYYETTWDNEDFLFGILYDWISGKDKKDIDDSHGSLDDVENFIPEYHRESLKEVFDEALKEDWYEFDSSRK